MSEHEASAVASDVIIRPEQRFDFYAVRGFEMLCVGAGGSGPAYNELPFGPRSEGNHDARFCGPP